MVHINLSIRDISQARSVLEESYKESSFVVNDKTVLSHLDRLDMNYMIPSLVRSAGWANLAGA
jgi:hypothetical protein